MMPNNAKKIEQKAMKRRRKLKAEDARKKQLNSGTTTKITIQNARELPIMECLISADWQKDDLGLVQIVVARQQLDERLTFGVYLIDMYCLGLKNTFCHVKMPVDDYKQQFVATLHKTTPMKKCDPELAHQIIYQAIDYAAKYSFKPNKDFKQSQWILETRDHYPENPTLVFGKNGKPFFVQGPNDNARAILQKLEQTAGAGNYDYLAMPFF